MAVWYEQRADGEITDGPRIVEPHWPDQSDAELLDAKRQGAADKGWAVRRRGASSFTATKKRWGGVNCVRRFWIEP